MNLLTRVKRIWQASKYDEELLEKQADLAEAIDAVQGDGNAVFIGEGSHEEFEEMEKESKGLKGIFGL